MFCEKTIRTFEKHSSVTFLNIPSSNVSMDRYIHSAQLSLFGFLVRVSRSAELKLRAVCHKSTPFPVSEVTSTHVAFDINSSVCPLSSVILSHVLGSSAHCLCVSPVG